jgi:hypothetical protein
VSGAQYASESELRLEEHVRRILSELDGEVLPAALQPPPQPLLPRVEAAERACTSLRASVRCVCLPASLSVCLSVCLSACLPVCPSVCLSLSVCLSARSARSLDRGGLVGAACARAGAAVIESPCLGN